MSLLIKDVVDKLENLIPPDLQEDWDNSGYQIKLSNLPLTGIVTSLDLSKKSLDLSIETNSNLILIHHPLFFHPLRFIDLNSATGRFSETLINNKICVYAMHTNFDSSVYSMSRYILNKLSAKNIIPLVPTKRNLYKLSVFIPKGYVKVVRETLFKYGNPKIGNYENCSFETKGKGSFKPLSGSDPFIGESGKTSFVDESKLEILIEERFINQAVQEMKKVHPYEEVAFDIFPLYDFGGTETGIGAVGVLECAVTLDKILENISVVFSPSFVNYCGKLNKKVKKIAVVSGSGFSFVDNAIKIGCDLFISSELKHSSAIKANMSGISLVEMSHFDTEKYFSEIIKNIIIKEFGSDFPIFENKSESAPFNKFK